MIRILTGPAEIFELRSSVRVRRSGTKEAADPYREQSDSRVKIDSRSYNSLKLTF